MLGFAEDANTNVVPGTGAALLTTWLKVVDDWPNAMVAIRSTTTATTVVLSLEILIKLPVL